MLEFLLALLATATVGALLWPLLRPRVEHRDRLAGELAIYRDQLAELERERSAGAIAEPEAAAARLEIERRILAAGAAAPSEPAEAGPASASRLHAWVPPALSFAVPLLALGLYLQTGRPGLPAAPFDAMTAAHSAPAPQIDIPGLLADARARLQRNPDDTDALAALGEGLTLEAGGIVTLQAAQAFQRALELAPPNQPVDPRTQYYLGLQQEQSGDSRAAIERWRAFEAQSPPDAPWLGLLRQEIARVARAAGIELPSSPAPSPSGTMPRPTMPQPTRDQQEAMAALSPEQRQQAIRSMVEGLAARLEQTPQDRDGWLRLANAWKVLGDNAKAADAFGRADTLGPVDARILADWAESHVRQLAPGAPPSREAVAVLERLEKAEPRNALALFYLGAAALAAGNKPGAVQRWRTLLALLPADAPIRPMLEQRIKEAEGG